MPQYTPPVVGLDVYVGTMTRYLSGDWKTIVQQAGESMGTPVVMIRKNEAADAIRDPLQIRPAVIVWRGQLAKGLGIKLATPFDWGEEDTRPYFTDKPDWDGYLALLLLASYEEKGKARPEHLRDDAAKDRVLADARDKSLRYRQILLPAMWLPAPFDFVFTGEHLTGQRVTYGSAPNLLAALTELNERTFMGSPEDLGRWRFEGPTSEKPRPFERTARFALAVFLQLAEKAVSERLPIILDY
ncbi:MAG TPA: hypothetical protein VK732_04770 [Verrucomicrobiae bacterium]|nr:hypothetical protein [Verrucomicrobiae bacterium]